MADLYKAYLLCMLVGSFLAFVLNFFEGDLWLKKEKKNVGQGQGAVGDTALDECLWFVFTTMHSVAMNDFMPYDVYGRVIGMFLTAFSYWFVIYMMAIVMLNQLPGEKPLGASGVAERLVMAVWPSYLVILIATVGVGCTLGPYLSDDPNGDNYVSTGVYWLWTIVHRQPFGDIFPNTPFSRTVTVPFSMLSNIYIPYALAVVAVRKPTREEHECLLDYLRRRPEDALGRGYVIPRHESFVHEDDRSSSAPGRPPARREHVQARELRFEPPAQAQIYYQPYVQEMMPVRIEPQMQVPLHYQPTLHAQEMTTVPLYAQQQQSCSLPNGSQQAFSPRQQDQVPDQALSKQAA